MLTRRLLLTLAAAAAVSPAWSTERAPPVVTVLGDSITAGYGLRASDALPAQLEVALRAMGAPARVRAAGVSGDTTAGGLARLDFSVRPDTAVCVVALGGNDLLQGIEPAEIAANLDRIVKRLKARGIAVVLAGGRAPGRSLGAYGRAIDQVFPTVAAANRVILAPDLMAGVSDRPEMKQSDGLHPNAAGARLIARRLAPAVVRALKGRG